MQKKKKKKQKAWSHLENKTGNLVRFLALGRPWLVSRRCPLYLKLAESWRCGACDWHCGIEPLSNLVDLSRLIDYASSTQFRQFRRSRASKNSTPFCSASPWFGQIFTKDRGRTNLFGRHSTTYYISEYVGLMICIQTFFQKKKDINPKYKETFSVVSFPLWLLVSYVKMKCNQYRY